MAIRPLDDISALRDEFFTSASDSVRSLFPLSNEQVSLELEDLTYAQRPITRSDERTALVNDQTLQWNLRGRLVLRDAATGKVLDRQVRTLASVPYLTDRATFIYRGNDYSGGNSLKLRPGVYTRWTASGMVEAPIHASGGHGMVVYLDPQSGEFKLRLQQSELKLYPLLSALGIDDAQLGQLWGPVI